jgi:hypothetical protein
MGDIPEPIRYSGCPYQIIKMTIVEKEYQEQGCQGRSVPWVLYEK